jgi:predicted nucleic acid-binding protein
MILDTNIIIYLLKCDEKVVNFMNKQKQVAYSISVISEMELEIGIEEHEVPKGTFEEIMKPISIIPVTSVIGKKSVNILKEKGNKSLRQITFHDVIIAATALHLNQPLVTRNVKDFKAFKGLKLINPFK